MTVAFDTTTSSATPPVRVRDWTAAAPAHPFIVTCMGEVEYTEDDPALGTWWQQQTLIVGQCGSVGESITFANRSVEGGAFPIDDEEALGFAPMLFIISDRDRPLVLAGEVRASGILWCQPVASDTEARQVVQEASGIRAEASFEAGWDNYSTAKRLRHRASVLEGRLVDPFWREEVRQALREVV